jgi:hypothetical protein
MAEVKADKPKTDQARKWLSELKLSKKEDEKWSERAKKIVRRYRDERTGWADNTKRYNILWSNIQTMLPALYGKTPRADVQRRFKDQDPIGRTAAQILERALQYEIDHYGDFDASIKNAVLDRLLPGRGVVWVRFETKERDEAYADPEVLEEGNEEVTDSQPEVPNSQYECTPVDYVFWEDFRCSPARTWDEVTWVARRVYMTQKDGIERFGEDFKDVPLTHEPIGLDELKNQQIEVSDMGDMKKAQVWEIWVKPTKTVFWVAEGCQNTLDEKEDPYGLDSFWPIPRPLYATQTTDTLVPVPDFAQYQDQAQELDNLTNRIAMLVEAVKVVGVYDASQKGVERMLSEGVNNTLIPVDNWAAFSEKGGIKGVVDFLPLEMVLTALNECYASREQAKQVIYEITGLSDIIRGASVASETATAQQIKSQYASLRLKRLQTDVAQFASEVLRIKAQMMADLYSPQNLIEMSGIMGTQDAQFAEQAIQLLKQEPSRSFRIEVASDSLVEMDEQTEKESRMEFLNAAGGFLQQALPAAQQAPELMPLLAEMLLYGVRAFKGGRQMEAAFDTAMAQMTAPKEPQQPPPDPEQIKMEGQMQIEQGRMQLEQAKLQGAAQLEQLKIQNQQQVEAARMQHEQQMELMRQQAETERATYKANLDAQTKLEIAQIQADSKAETSVVVDGKGELTAKGDELAQAGQEMRAVAEQSTQAIAEAMSSLADAVTQMNKPKRRVLEMGPDGRAIGAIEVIE